MGTPPPFSQDYLSANKGPQALSIIIAFPIIAAFVVSLRMITRIKIVNNPSHDDWTMLGALIFSIATAICQGFQVKNGMGRHVQSLTMEQGINSLKALFASIMMYNFSLTLIKVSIIFQYLRIAANSYVRLACHILMAFILLNCTQTFLTAVFSCVPVPKFWDDRIVGTCVNKPALWFANAGINIVQDIWLIVLPFFILKKLILRTREKVVLMIILGLGGFASVASILRLQALYVVSKSHDITWDNPGTATWSTIELNVGIICASLPTLRALLSKIFPQIFKSTLQAPRDGYHGASRRNVRHTTDTDLDMEEHGNIVIKTDIILDERTRYPSLSTTSSEGPQNKPWG
ncbi:hypothetical protein GQ43DRAFT_223315 [Delitschia confertaspora ATCC 74209]|uniref:Rhodopsin domain-containing protein n=1 Tax=Delitschia confertaspora ATCC 74209 TaxID=1513339 RepID=A0A9P4JI37_9PLEO|nr:hypothetical protein GQ43DRAFT_223315 [Delitschia confertaspora ATCC 74209]